MDQTILKSKWDSLNPLLDERARRIWAATEAVAIGHSGITLVADVTGLSRTTIHAGIKELQGIQKGKLPPAQEGDRLRAAGSGRKRLAIKDTTLLADLELLVDPATKGDPMSPLRWTSKSTIHLAKALEQRGHKVSPRTVAAMLIDQGYSLQANRKSKESEIHPDRDQQVEQDRAPHVLPHHPELARPAPCEPGSGGEADRNRHERPGGIPYFTPS